MDDEQNAGRVDFRTIVRMEMVRRAQAFPTRHAYQKASDVLRFYAAGISVIERHEGGQP